MNAAMDHRTDSQTVCVVTAGGPLPWIITNALGQHFGPVTVIMEEPERRAGFLRRRARKVGWISVAGQFLTMLWIRTQKKISAAKIGAIVAQHGLEVEPNPAHPIIHVPTVNSEAFVAASNRVAPAIILLVGCRIVKADILSRLRCPVLNYHAGINPDYRGMNCGYWALATGDVSNFGATVHLVDAGVDTGAILRQVRGAPGPSDTIATYPYILAASSRDMCALAIKDALDGKLATAPAGGRPSRQWYHPPLWTYLWVGLTKGVW